MSVAMFPFDSLLVELRNEIVNRFLDRPSRLALGLTCSDFRKRYFDPKSYSFFNTIREAVQLDYVDWLRSAQSSGARLETFALTQPSWLDEALRVGSLRVAAFLIDTFGANENTIKRYNLHLKLQAQWGPLYRLFSPQIRVGWEDRNLHIIECALRFIHIPGSLQIIERNRLRQILPNYLGFAIDNDEVWNCLVVFELLRVCKSLENPTELEWAIFMDSILSKGKEDLFSAALRAREVMQYFSKGRMDLGGSHIAGLLELYCERHPNAISDEVLPALDILAIREMDVKILRCLSKHGFQFKRSHIVSLIEIGSLVEVDLSAWMACAEFFYDLGLRWDSGEVYDILNTLDWATLSQMKWLIERIPNFKAFSKESAFFHVARHLRPDLEKLKFILANGGEVTSDFLASLAFCENGLELLPEFLPVPNDQTLGALTLRAETFEKYVTCLEGVMNGHRSLPSLVSGEKTLARPYNSLLVLDLLLARGFVVNVMIYSHLRSIKNKYFQSRLDEILDRYNAKTNPETRKVTSVAILLLALSLSYLIYLISR